MVYYLSLTTRLKPVRSESAKRPARREPDRALRGTARGLEAAGHLDLLEHFDLVTSFNVVVALNADTAFHAGTYFGHVVLEATQRFQLAFEDNHVFTQYTNRTVTVHNTFQHHTAGNGAEL